MSECLNVSNLNFMMCNRKNTQGEKGSDNKIIIYPRIRCKLSSEQNKFQHRLNNNGNITLKFISNRLPYAVCKS